MSGSFSFVGCIFKTNPLTIGKFLDWGINDQQIIYLGIFLFLKS